MYTQKFTIHPILNSNKQQSNHIESVNEIVLKEAKTANVKLISA